MYRHFVKRFLDILMSSIAIVLLAVPMLIIAIVIKIDDPGPVLFKQRRIGINKNGKITYFMIWKFRSMKMSTPHDTPTHLLENPEQYITRVGKFMRKTSIDELPQIYQVFSGKLSAIGPRPGLWTKLNCGKNVRNMVRMILNPALLVGHKSTEETSLKFL